MDGSISVYMYVCSVGGVNSSGNSGKGEGLAMERRWTLLLWRV